MKTSELVNVLANDGIYDRHAIWRNVGKVLPVCMLMIAVVFFTSIGMRANISAGQALMATSMKLVITASLAILGLRTAVKLAKSNQESAATRYVLLLVPAILAAMIVVDLLQTGASGWYSRLIGASGWRCVVTIPLLSILPLGGILFAFRDAAVTRHALTGAVAGIAAAGIGASFYALNCGEDSPLFLAFWYGIATAIVAAAGAIACRMTMRW